MIEAYGDIWDHADDYHFIVITTNGFVKKNGEAVMGRGIALEAKTRYPDLPLKLGNHIKKYGNIVGWFQSYVPTIITLPVKPEFGPNGEPGWKAKADINLIKEQVEYLDFTVKFNVLDGPLKVLMPRPGCGNGGLKWEQVKPVIEPILDDRYIVMERI